MARRNKKGREIGAEAAAELAAMDAVDTTETPGPAPLEAAAAGDGAADDAAGSTAGRDSSTLPPSELTDGEIDAELTAIGDPEPAQRERVAAWQRAKAEHDARVREAEAAIAAMETAWKAGAKACGRALERRRVLRLEREARLKRDGA